MIQFSPHQTTYIANATHRYNFKLGAVRSGKSFVDVAYTIPARLRNVRNEPGLNVILGVSKETIERNVLEPMREIYTSDLVSTINSRNIATVCGVPVYCLGAEKITQVSKIQGMSIKYCYGDEIAKWSQEVFAMLQSRLDKSYSMMDGACNPEHPGHWLKEFLDRDDIDTYVQKYTIFDNPFLNRDFVSKLCKEYEGTVYYKRYILGEWALAEGLIYPMYSDAIAAPPTGLLTERYVLSIDYGTLNAFAALLWEKKGPVWYATRGYYYSGRENGTCKTDAEYLADLESFLQDIFTKLAEGQKLKTIVDPSAASFITLLKKNRHFAVMPADNAVSDGIRETATAMQRGDIKINPSIKEWVKEAEGYVWDEKRDDDAPVKIDDHYMDATRYFVKTMHIVSKRPQAAAQSKQSMFM